MAVRVKGESHSYRQCYRSSQPAPEKKQCGKYATHVCTVDQACGFARKAGSGQIYISAASEPTNQPSEGIAVRQLPSTGNAPNSISGLDYRSLQQRTTRTLTYTHSNSNSKQKQDGIIYDIRAVGLGLIKSQDHVKHAYETDRERERESHKFTRTHEKNQLTRYHIVSSKYFLVLSGRAPRTGPRNGSLERGPGCCSISLYCTNHGIIPLHTIPYTILQQAAQEKLLLLQELA